MPIQLTCPTCGKKLQIGDQYAGRRVGCPGCKSVITAPGGPTGSGTAAPPATRPAAPRPAAPAPKPAPPAPAREESAPAVDDDAFSFGPPKTKKGADEDDAPRKPRGKAAPATKRRNDDDDEDDLRPPSKSRPGARSDTEEEKRYTSKSWASFGSGSRMARAGLWIEFFSLAYGIALFAYITFVLTRDPYGRSRGLLLDVGPWILLPLFAGSFAGVMMAFAGRTKMMSIPQGTGAKRVFLGAWLFTLLRFFAAVAGLVLSILGAVSSDIEQGRYIGLAFMALAIGVPFWGLADLSSIPAMAIVGGVIPSRNLRRQAGKVTFAMQIIMLLYIAIVVGFYINENNSRSSNDFRASRSGTSDPQTVIAIVLGVVLLLQLIYTLLYSALYSAGSRAVLALRDAEDRAVDED